MIKCCINGCSKQNEDGVSFHRFPKDETLSKWIEFSGVVETSSANKFVCSLHFTEDSLNKFNKIRETLHSNAYPTLHPPTDIPPVCPIGSKVDPLEETIYKSMLVKQEQMIATSETADIDSIANHDITSSVKLEVESMKRNSFVLSPEELQDENNTLIQAIEDQDRMIRIIEQKIQDIKKDFKIYKNAHPSSVDSKFYQSDDDV